ncbi:MAG: alpha/beta fold hydrolase, partial [Pseudomonadota bacterium]
PDFMLDGARVWGLAHALTSARSAGRAPVLMGHSAGGHIAALLVLNARFAHLARALAAQTAVAGSSDVLAGDTVVRLGRLASLLAKRSDDDLLHLSDRGSAPDDTPPAVAPCVEGPLAPRGLITLAAPFAMYPTIYAGTREIFAPAPRTNDPRPYANLGAAMATPHLILHGARDRLIDPWIVDDYAAKLRDLGVDGWRMRKLAGLGHVGIMAALVPGVGRLLDPRQSVRREIIRWLSALSHDDSVAPNGD